MWLQSYMVSDYTKFHTISMYFFMHLEPLNYSVKYFLFCCGLCSLIRWLLHALRCLFSLVNVLMFCTNWRVCRIRACLRSVSRVFCLFVLDKMLGRPLSAADIILTRILGISFHGCETLLESLEKVHLDWKFLAHSVNKRAKVAHRQTVWILHNHIPCSTVVRQSAVGFTVFHIFISYAC